MPKGCIVPFCKNRGPKRGVRFFKISARRRQAWLRSLGRNEGEQISIHNVVCSDHFCKEDFLDNGSLKKDAAPTQLLRPGGRPTLVSCQDRLNLLFLDEHRQPVASSSTTQEIPEEELENVQIYDKPYISMQHDNSEDNKYSMPGPSVTARVKRKWDTSEGQTSSSDSEGLKGSPKNRRRLLRLDHAYSLSPRKMKTTLTETRQIKSNLRLKLNTLKRKIQRLEKRMNTITGLVSHLRNKKIISDEVVAFLEKSYSRVPVGCRFFQGPLGSK